MIRKKALIIGGGIAGTAAAMALQKIGFEATIYEAYQKPAYDVGATMGLAINGLDALRILDAHEVVKAIGFPAPNTMMWLGSGRCLGQFSGGTALSDGTVNMIVRRADLYTALMEETRRRGLAIELGKKLVNVQDRKTEVIAQFADGSEAIGDLLIGADGISSRVRQLVDPMAPKPEYVGLIGTFGYAYNMALTPTPNTFHMIYGKRAFFAYTVREDGTVWWFINIPWVKEPSVGELSTIPRAEWKRKMIDLVSEDASFAKQIIQATTHDFELIAMHLMEPPTSWHHHKMVLIGDAAHVTSPSSGQGASLAIEDALTLTRCLRDCSELSQAFTAYQKMRHTRIQKIITGARAVNRSKASGPVARLIRDAVMPLMMKFTKSDAYAWMYNYHINFDQPIDQDMKQAQ